MGVKITGFELENVKRVKAVALDCSGRALTVVGGRNAQGKTSVLDAIIWALGGDRYRPSNPVREGAEEVLIRIALDNGVIVERKGKNGALKVTSPSGRGGQALLNEFVSAFALDLPKFMSSSGVEKAKILLEVFPELGIKIQKLNEQVKALYNERHSLGQIADRKAKYAQELPFDSSAPEQPLSGAEMAKRMQEALSHNAHNAGVRRSVVQSQERLDALTARESAARKRVLDLEGALQEARSDLHRCVAETHQAASELDVAKGATTHLQDKDTTSIQQELEQIDAINARVRANESKRNAEEEARVLRTQYNEATTRIEELRAERLKLLATVRMPLDELTIDEEGELIYRAQRWDCMSSAEQLRVATAICATIKPACGFVLLDRLECLDVETLREFGAWLEEKGLQAIGTRVATGDECAIVIEDGMEVGTKQEEETSKEWKF